MFETWRLIGWSEQHVIGLPDTICSTLLVGSVNLPVLQMWSSTLTKQSSPDHQLSAHWYPRQWIMHNLFQVALRRVATLLTAVSMPAAILKSLHYNSPLRPGTFLSNLRVIFCLKYRLLPVYENGAVFGHLRLCYFLVHACHRSEHQSRMLAALSVHRCAISPWEYSPSKIFPLKCATIKV